MNTQIAILELLTAGLGLVVLLADLWTPSHLKKALGYAVAAVLGVFLLGSFSIDVSEARQAFGGMFVLDRLALFFKQLFLLAAIIIVLLSVDLLDRFETGKSEYFSLLLFALTGMMFAASSNDLVLVFVSLELISVTFYILTSYQRKLYRSLEAGIKYLILGAVASAFMIYGIALVFGTAGTTNFNELASRAGELSGQALSVAGILMILAGLGFKIAAVPFQFWAPDVYEGSPVPTSAFLAIGSKAAGFALLLRLLFSAVPEISLGLENLWIWMAALTILYGNLCAIPQRNLKRLLGYSSISNAGYILLGVAALNQSGSAAVLYYLTGYLFTVLAAFVVVGIGLKHVQGEDLRDLSGLHLRSPLLAAALTLSMISLAGIPPLAGFFGKFLLLKAVVQQAAESPGYYCLLGAAIAGVVISIYYYFGVIRAIYRPRQNRDETPIPVSIPMRVCLYGCIAGMLYLGVFPNKVVNIVNEAVTVLAL